MSLKEAAIFLAEAFETVGMTAAVWHMTTWGIGRVMLGGMLLTGISNAAVYLGFHAAHLLCERKRLSRIERLKLEHRRRAKFKVYDLQGELIEIPVPGTDMVEIRYVVAGTKSNILPPTKAVQDVG